MRVRLPARWLFCNLLATRPSSPGRVSFCLAGHFFKVFQYNDLHHLLEITLAPHVGWNDGR
jgi:hypothetical protein